MIGEPAALLIKESISRPDRFLINRFNVSTTHIADALNGHSSMRHTIRPLDREMKLCGPAVTAYCGAGDNLAAMAALDFVTEGDVIVISCDNDRSSAKIGDLWLSMAAKLGVAGVVCDGLVRDYHGLLKTKIPVFCYGLAPNSSLSNGPGTINQTVSCGGTIVKPGDIISADVDGVVSIANEKAEDIAINLENIATAELSARSAIESSQEYHFWDPEKFNKRIELIRSD